MFHVDIIIHNLFWPLVSGKLLQCCGAGAGGAEIILGPGAGAGAGAENKF